METPDIWDDGPASQRKDRRYLARWKAALVFDHTTAKPIFHTLTHDLSMNGISVQYHAQEKVDTVLTVLLAPPPLDGVQQRIVRLKAKVVSSVPFRGGFRLGMNFIEDAELGKLRNNFEMFVATEDSLSSYPEGDAFPTLDF